MHWLQTRNIQESIYLPDRCDAIIRRVVVVRQLLLGKRHEPANMLGKHGTHTAGDNEAGTKCWVRTNPHLLQCSLEHEVADAGDRWGETAAFATCPVLMR